MLDGPLHIGCRVAVIDGRGVACMLMLDGCVDALAELELVVSLPDWVGIVVLKNREVEPAVRVG